MARTLAISLSNKCVHDFQPGVNPNLLYVHVAMYQSRLMYSTMYMYNVPLAHQCYCSLKEC